MALESATQRTPAGVPAIEIQGVSRRFVSPQGKVVPALRDFNLKHDYALVMLLLSGPV